MDVLLVSGFLGAGKTTLINHLLSSGTAEIGKVAVIVNEVGELGIDGELLSGRNVDMIELAGGCICCTIRTGFFNAVQEIYDRARPDFLVVEATGVAQPGEILDILFELPQSESIRLGNLITVVDAGFFEARKVLASFYDNQIRFADILILNKMDQVEAGTLEEIRTLLRELNPGGKLLTASYCTVEPSLLFGRYYGDGIRDSHATHGHGDHDGHHHEKSGFQSFFFKDQAPLNRQKLVDFLESLPPTLFRLKGWVRFPDASAFIDFTGGRYRIEPVDNRHATALAFVGRGCNKEEILLALNACSARGPADS
jgi:G3E family GTPase